MSEQQVKSGVSTAILNVDLDTSNDPAVIIDDRNKKADSGGKIKWQKASGAASFKFHDFGPKGNEFTNVDVADNKIECDFNSAKPPNSAHPYTVLVEDDDGGIHSSDKSEGAVNPVEGKAVIRN